MSVTQCANGTVTVDENTDWIAGASTSSGGSHNSEKLEWVVQRRSDGSLGMARGPVSSAVCRFSPPPPELHRFSCRPGTQLPKRGEHSTTKMLTRQRPIVIGRGNSVDSTWPIDDGEQCLRSSPGKPRLLRLPQVSSARLITDCVVVRVELVEIWQQTWPLLTS